MSILDKLKLLSQFGDELVSLLGLAAEFSAATTVEAKAQIVVRGVKIIAAQTPTDLDDLSAELVQAFFDSPKVVEAAKRLADAILAASQS
jgi:hypothetical protein